MKGYVINDGARGATVLADGAPTPVRGELLCSCSDPAYFHFPAEGATVLGGCRGCDCASFEPPPPPSPRVAAVRDQAATVRAVTAVLALHSDDGHGFCSHCDVDSHRGFGRVSYPCATAAAVVEAGFLLPR